MNVTEDDLDRIFEEFKQKIAHLSFTQSFTKSVSESALSKLSKEYEAARDQGRESSLSRMTNLICYDILKNTKEVIAFKDASYAEHLHILKLQHNKQYQWLLVEAYEAFEDYLTKLYAYCGYLDNDFWENEDFTKDKSPSDINKLELDWFVKRAKNKRRLPESILKQVNKKTPSLARILAIRKRDNPRIVDYEFMIVLISKLRHQIVHTHGYVDKNEFIKSRH